MAALDRKGKYQPWDHEAFVGDPRVRKMTPLARKTYMTLLHEAFVCSTRPLLPDDEEELEIMADCVDNDEWLSVRAAVLGMFQKMETTEGPRLANKRLLQDWETLLDIREKRSEAGKASGVARRTKSNTCEQMLDQNEQVKRREEKRREVNLSEENEDDTDMKIKKEIQAVCAGYGANAGGYQDTWEQMAALEKAHSRGAVVRDFTEFMSENQGDDFPKGAVSSYLKTAFSRLSDGGTSVQSAAKVPEVQELVRTLSRVSGGQIDFLDKHRARLGEVLKEFTAEEIATGFKNWLADQDVADLPKFGAGKFAQVADSRADQVRISRIEKQKAESEREAAKIRLQEEAEAERARVEAEKKSEEDLDDPLNM